MTVLDMQSDNYTYTIPPTYIRGFFQNTHIYYQFLSKICQKCHQKLLSTHLYAKKSSKTHPRLQNFPSKTPHMAREYPYQNLREYPRDTNSHRSGQDKSLPLKNSSLSHSPYLSVWSVPCGNLSRPCFL